MKRETTVFHSQMLGEHYTLTRHKSGLPIYIFPKKLTTAYALFAVNFGSVDNRLPNGETMPDGVAHFLEHKLFSNEDGSDAFEHFSAIGADANAYTSEVRTVYLFSCTENFEKALTELLDFVTHPYFTPETVAKEQGIIAEEIRMCRDNPYNACFYNMLAGLYEHHPVKIEICGSEASIAAITPDVLYTAYKTYYQLPNMALIVCGDVDEASVLALADRCLPQTAAPFVEPPCRVTPERPSAAKPVTVTRGQVAKPIFCIGVKDADLPEDSAARIRRDAVMAVLSEMLFSASGDLYNDLYDRGLISPGLSSEYVLTRDFGFLQVAGESGDPQAVLGEIRRYIEEKQQKGLDRADFERCRRIEYAEFIKGFDATEEIANTLLSFVFEQADYFGYADLVQSLTFEETQQTLRQFFRPEAFTLSVVEPWDDLNKEHADG